MMEFRFQKEGLVKGRARFNHDALLVGESPTGWPALDKCKMENQRIPLVFARDSPFWESDVKNTDFNFKCVNVK